MSELDGWMTQASRSLKRDQMSNSGVARERIESLYAAKTERQTELDQLADAGAALSAEYDASDRDVLSGLVTAAHARWREFSESLVQTISFNVSLLSSPLLSSPLLSSPLLSSPLL